LPDGINGWYRTFAKYFNPDLTPEQLVKVCDSAERFYVQALKQDPKVIDYVRNYLALQKPRLALSPASER